MQWMCDNLWFLFFFFFQLWLHQKLLRKAKHFFSDSIECRNSILTGNSTAWLRITIVSIFKFGRLGIEW